MMVIGLVVMIMAFPFCWVASQHFNFGVFLFFLALYLKAFIAPSQGLGTSISIYPHDILFIIIGGAVVVRYLFFDKISKRSLPWLFWGILLIASFLRGFSLFGSTAGVPFRNFFYVWVTVFYFMSFQFRPLQIKSIINSWFIFSALLSLSILLRWVFDPAEIGLTWLRENSEVSLRVIPSEMALILAQSMVLAIMLSAEKKKYIWRFWVPLWILQVAILQHRSVWLATLVGIVVAYLSVGRIAFFKSMVFKIIIFVFIIAFAGSILNFIGILDFNLLLDSFRTSFHTAIYLETTAGERIYSWTLLLKQWFKGGIPTWLFGFPFGTSIARNVSQQIISTRIVEYSPHNNYVEIILYTGLVGFFLFISVYLKTILGLLHCRNISNNKAGLNGHHLTVLLMMQLAYFVSYGGNFHQALWLGLGIAWLSSAKREVYSIQGDENYSDYPKETATRHQMRNLL